LIVGRPGILDILDEQCKVGGTSTSFLNRMNNDNLFIDSPYYTYDNLKKNAFYIKHYAGKIRYTTNEFCLKNRDAISNEVTDIIDNFALFKKNNNISLEEVPIRRNSVIGSKSVSYQFKQQMRDLMLLIESTNVHYIRCFKPNNINKSNVFNRVKILEQLNNNGVLETIRVSRNSFPVKYTYTEFNQIYLFNKYDNDRLLRPNIETDNIFNIFDKLPLVSGKHSIKKHLTSSLLKGSKSQADNEGFQFGKTKIFLKSDAFNKLEQHRMRLIYKYALVIQTLYRKWLYSTIYIKKKTSIIVLSSNIKKYIALTKYKRALLCIIKLQAFFRRMRCVYTINAMHLLNTQIIELEDIKTLAIIQIQSIVRKWLQIIRIRKIKTEWNNATSHNATLQHTNNAPLNKNEYKLLDYGELLNKYITEISDSLDKSNIINELYQMNEELSNENKALRKSNNDLIHNNNNLIDNNTNLKEDNKSYIECVKTNIEKRIELLYKIDEYKIKNEILASKFNDIYNKL